MEQNTKNVEPILGLKDEQPKGFEEFKGKQVLLNYSTGMIIGKLEDVDEDGFAKFSEIIEQEFGETGSKYVKSTKTNKVDLRTLTNTDMKEITDEDIRKYSLRNPKNRIYLSEWIFVNNVAGKLCYVDTEVIRLCPVSVNGFTKEGKSVTRLEEKIPVTMPNQNLTIVPTTEESVMNYIKYNNSKLEEKVKE